MRPPKVRFVHRLKQNGLAINTFADVVDLHVKALGLGPLTIRITVARDFEQSSAPAIVVEKGSALSPSP